MYGNNYGYNPYNSYIPQRPIQQPIEQNTQFTPQKNVSNIKQVDSIEVVRASEIPYDFNPNFFYLTDGSAIVIKQYQQDGTCKMITYKPVFTDDKPQRNFATIDEIDSLKEQIKKLEQKITELQEVKKTKKKEEDA